MAQLAELHCYHCGYQAGQVYEEAGKPLEIIRPVAGPGVRFTPDHGWRCGRCGGPLYVDEVTNIPDGVGVVSGYRLPNDRSVRRAHVPRRRASRDRVRIRLVRQPAPGTSRMPKLEEELVST